VEEFLPQGKAKTAVIVCPGGSYCWLSKKTEGREVAQWLTSHGYAAYVLYYPTAGWAGFAWHSRYVFRGRQYPDQIEALNEVLHQVHGKGYQKVGVMGFSAGGHLALLSAEYSPRQYSPDFIAPIYPVVTLSSPCVHHRSRRGLLGEWRWRNQTICDSLSMEKHADRILCPVFIVNCLDDPIVHYHNAELMDSALTACHVSHEYHQYKTGGHGFGVNPKKTSQEAIKWKEAFLEWLKNIR
jgi:acetyl esterase/lipase